MDAPTAGLHRATGRKDRPDIRSASACEPGGVLLEVTTNGPGSTRDRATESLGTTLGLATWLDEDGTVIEALLPPMSAGTRADAD